MKSEFRKHLDRAKLLRDRDDELEKYAAYPDECRRIADEFAMKLRMNEEN